MEFGIEPHSLFQARGTTGNDHISATLPCAWETVNTVALHIVLGIYCTSHYIYTKIQAKFLSNQDERAPLVASEAIRVPLGHFASY